MSPRAGASGSRRRARAPRAARDGEGSQRGDGCDAITRGQRLGHGQCCDAADVQPAGARRRFRRSRDYGFLSDCHTGALVSSDGAIEWMCLPHFDCPAVFAAMLDRGAGSFRIGPYGTYVPVGRRYIPGTNLIETTWMTAQGWLRVIDGLTIGEWHDNKHGSSHTRPPTDFDADHLLVRWVECVQGEVQVELVCEPLFGYGAVSVTLDCR